MSFEFLDKFMDALVMGLAVFLQDWLPKLGAWTVLIALLRIGLTVFWIFLVEKFVLYRIKDELKVESEKIGLGPIHGKAAMVVVKVGVAHLLLNLGCRALLSMGGISGAAGYGPQGWALSAMGLDILAPLPYLVALPFALLFYSYVYTCALYGFGLFTVSGKSGALWYLKILLVAPFIWLVFPIVVLRSFVDKMRKASKAKKKDKAQASENEEGEEGEEGEEAPEVQEEEPEEEEEEEEEEKGEIIEREVSSGGMNDLQWGIVLGQGHSAVERSRLLEDGTEKPIEGHFFRLLDRYTPLLQPWSLWLT
ncbi:MAG: hypothetical protein VX938_12125, partial [Myxococcota bacterium]|nr:hypothetical protein [Myxococcota bacterium]